MNEKTVIKCIHCNGTGICSHSTVYYEKSKSVIGQGVLWKRCQKCGDGLSKSYSYIWNDTPSDSDIRDANPRPPFCSVCGGKGYTSV